MIRYRIAIVASIVMLVAAACGGGDAGPDTLDAQTPDSSPGPSIPGSAVPPPPPAADPTAPAVPAVAGAPNAEQIASTPDSGGETPDSATVLDGIVRAMQAAGAWELRGVLTVRETPDADKLLLVSQLLAARSGPGANIVITSSRVDVGQIQGGVFSENRLVDGKRYRRDPNSGLWTVTDAGDTSPTLTIDAGVVAGIDAETATVEIANLNGEMVFHVTGTVPGESAAAKAEVYAGVDDLLLRSMRIEGLAPVENFGGLLPGFTGQLAQIVEASYNRVGGEIHVNVPPAALEPPDAETRTYLSTIHPLTMRIPGDWQSMPRSQLAGETFNGPSGEALFITEEYVDLPETLALVPGGGAVTTEVYSDLVEQNLAATVPGYELISTEPFTTDSGLQTRLTRFSENNGEVQWAHLTYVLVNRLGKGMVGFGATFGARTEQFAGIEDMLTASFRSFRLAE